jgi:hypothetical protein
VSQSAVIFGETKISQGLKRSFSLQEKIHFTRSTPDIQDDKSYKNGSNDRTAESASRKDSGILGHMLSLLESNSNVTRPSSAGNIQEKKSPVHKQADPDNHGSSWSVLFHNEELNPYSSTIMPVSDPNQLLNLQTMMSDELRALKQNVDKNLRELLMDPLFKDVNIPFLLKGEKAQRKSLPHSSSWPLFYSGKLTFV